MAVLAPPARAVDLRQRGPEPARLLFAVAHALAWTFVAAVAIVLAAAVVVPRLGGATPYTILTSSMEPGLPPGTLVVVRPVPAEEIRVGDVITYQRTSGDPTVVTHRVVAVGGDQDGPLFRTRGDANDAADIGWVRPVQVRGRLWYDVPLLGRVNQAVAAEERRAATVLAVTSLSGYALLMWASAARDAARRRRDSPGVRR